MNWFYSIILGGACVYRKLGCPDEMSAEEEAREMVKFYRGSTWIVGRL